MTDAASALYAEPPLDEFWPPHAVRTALHEKYGEQGVAFAQFPWNGFIPRSKVDRIIFVTGNPIKLDLLLLLGLDVEYIPSLLASKGNAP